MLFGLVSAYAKLCCGEQKKSIRVGRNAKAKNDIDLVGVEPTASSASHSSKTSFG